MDNTERLAQALRIVRDWILPDSQRKWPDGRPMSYADAFGSIGESQYMRTIAAEALAEHDALASLAPVDGEFLNIANGCRAVATMKMLSVSARSRLLLAAEIVEKSSAQVAALTAQCEGMSCAAREYLAAVAHLFDSKAGKDGKFLAELSPLDDQQCLEAFKNLNDTGARLKKCCGGLQK